MGDVDGVMFRATFSWDGSGVPALTSASASPTFMPMAAGPISTPQRDVALDVLTIGAAAITGLGIGLASRAARGQRAFAPRDLALDALTGGEIGTCLIGTPQAESICLGALGALPLQIINRAIDPRWDFRIGMLTGGGLSLARSELGGNPMPYAGYRLSAGQAQLVPSELVANGFADVGWEAGFFALSNSVAALLNGHPVRDLPAFAGAGAGYGTALGTVLNLSIGAPLRLSPGLLSTSVARAREGGVDVSDVARYTTWRAGGIYQAVEGRASTTLGNTVHLAEMHINPETVSHELTHRDQIAGTPGDGARGGAGFLSFYSQYFAWAPGGYRVNPYEAEAFRVGDGLGTGAGPQPRFGDAIASPFALSLFLLPTLLMPAPTPR